nr:speedy protein E3-like [Aotus nancymaae]
MASHQRQPQVEEQSPQPSTSGYSLPEVVDNEMPGPSVPWVDPSPPLRFLCSKRKREWLDESEKLDEEPEKAHTPESEETWVVETLCDLKVKLKKRRVSPMLPEHHKVFNSLLEDPVIKRFLAWDKDLRVSDKVPPEEGMALCRVSTSPEPRTVPCPPLWEVDLSWRSLLVVSLSSNLISAPSYLVNDMEDDKAPKQAIFYFLYGKNCSQRPLFQKLRFQFFCSMHWRA